MASCIKAMILVAGKGERLKPLTDKAPKCLTVVNGTPILVNALDALQRCGIREVIIIVGYRGEKVRKEVGESYKGMSIRFVENDIYDKTNNIYSVWLGRDYIDDDILLIEGDVLFEEKILRALLDSPYRNSAAIDHYVPLLSGLVVNLSDDGLIKGMYLKAHQKDPGFDYSDKFKTVNIYKLSKSLTRKFLEHIEKRISAGNVNCFYEEALKDILDTEGYGKLFMKGVIVKGCKWFEIDTMHDITIAERVFGG